MIGVGVRDDGAAYTIETRAEVRAVAFPARMSATQAAATLDVAPSMQSLNPTAVAYDSTQITSAGNFSSPKDGDPCHPLSAGAQAPIFTLAIRGRGDGHDLEYRDDGTSNAILTPNGGRAGIGVGAIATSWSVRRLTPTECERLQGFPDGWTDIPHKGKPAADGPRYKALGNSMAVNVMRWIGQRIQQVEAIPCGIIYLTPEMG